MAFKYEPPRHCFLRGNSQEIKRVRCGKPGYQDLEEEIKADQDSEVVLFLPPLSLPQKNIFTIIFISEGQQAYWGQDLLRSHCYCWLPSGFPGI